MFNIKRVMIYLANGFLVLVALSAVTFWNTCRLNAICEDNDRIIVYQAEVIDRLCKQLEGYRWVEPEERHPPIRINPIKLISGKE